MKKLLFFAVCFMLLCSGCIQKDGGDTVGKSGGEKQEKILVTITSPHDLDILQGNTDVSFEGYAEGGKKPNAYIWSSNIDGTLSTRSSFRQNPSKLSKGQHTIILTATDANGITGQGTVYIDVY